MTDALQCALNRFKAYAPIAPLLGRVLDSTGSRSIVDMCSGGGGPWLEFAPKLRGNGRGALRIQLTDKYPNLRAFQEVRAASRNQIGFYPGPVDAMDVPRELTGVRTMFTSFHHFRPEQARAVLQNAVDAGQGIAIFEVTRRAASAIGLMFLWALTPFLITPFIRPLRWSQFFCTYVIPIIPMVFLFDGVVSCLRTYRVEELREIVAGLTAGEYQWEAGEYAGAAARAPITYLIGYPRVCEDN